jgi:hypothetical protein
MAVFFRSLGCRLPADAGSGLILSGQLQGKLRSETKFPRSSAFECKFLLILTFCQVPISQDAR